uniref:FP protein C-terminal domain-containing protein n=1 Tax=Cacopsylla melanoneura TaxID=428564 RepID=A0A8D8YY01_9HEMI
MSGRKKAAAGRGTQGKKIPPKPVISDSEEEEEEVEEVADLDRRIERVMQKVMNKFKKEIQKQINDLEKSLNFYGDKMEEYNDNMTKMMEKINKLENDNEVLKKELKTVRDDHENLLQYTMNKNIQIDGVPEVNDENLKELVIEIGKKIEVNVEEKEIDKAHRVPSRNPQNIPPIIVQFTTRQTRDNFIDKVRKNKITTKDVKRSGEEKFVYVNEHLTKLKKDIMYEARRLKQDKGYKFLWVRGGKVLMRKNETSRVFELRSFDDLSKIV